MKLKIYASRKITKHILRETSKRFLKKSELSIKCVPNGVIVVNQKKLRFGVFDQRGSCVKESLSWRRKRSLSKPPSNALKNLPYFDYDVVYLGRLDHTFGHFGHHLLERWDRTYAFLNEKYSNMKFVLANDPLIDPLPNFVVELARLLGIQEENFIVLGVSTRFRNVYVPEQGFRETEFSSREFGEIFAKTSENVKSDTFFDKIYVSRTALTRRKTYGEEKIQKIFEKNGYHIIYPEQLSLEEQIAFMKNCRSLAGCAGTALHLALFMPKGGQVIQIKRNKLKEDNSGTQYLITKTKKHDMILIDASIEKRKTKHFDDYATQIIGINEYMKHFFDEYGFNYSPNDVEPDKDAWDEYIRKTEKLKSRGEVWILERIVKLMACFIPNRTRRGTFRKRMKKNWGIV